MESNRSASNCKWAQPTVFLPLPYWINAWDTPWTCERDGHLRHIADTSECANCPRWEARAPVGAQWDLSQVGL